MAFLSSTVSAIGDDKALGCPEDMKATVKILVDKINEIIAEAGVGS